MRSIFYEMKEGFVIAFNALRANKVRSFLTMLSIVIGITAVVLMTTAIKGINNSFQNGISALGSDVLYIDKFAWFTNEDYWKIRNRRNISMDDFEKFKELAKLPYAVAPVIDSRQNLRYKNNKVDNVFLNGSTAEYLRTTNYAFSMGRFYTDIESNSARQVVVLGSEVADKLFPLGDALDKTIKIGTENYKVIGVLAKQGSFILGAFNPDNRVFVPIGSVFKNFVNNANARIVINIKAKSPALLEDTKIEAEGIMRKIRGLKYNEEDDFTINEQEGLMDNYNKVVGVVQIAGLIITGLSLFVGAVGIMNIMFVSVKERTREIGVRKAMGARKRAILGQFIFESSSICLMGGVVGLLLAIGLSFMVNQFIPTSVQYNAVVIAIVVSLITGVLAGLAPAYSAAKMDPVEALRYE